MTGNRTVPEIRLARSTRLGRDPGTGSSDAGRYSRSCASISPIIPKSGGPFRKRCRSGLVSRYRVRLQEFERYSRRIHGLGSALWRRQCASRFHGLGTGRRHGAGPVGRDAGGGAQCQSGRTRPYSHRGRAAAGAMGPSDVRFSPNRQRAVRHRHLHGQSDGGIGGAGDCAGRRQCGGQAWAPPARCCAAIPRGPRMAVCVRPSTCRAWARMPCARSK